MTSAYVALSPKFTESLQNCIRCHESYILVCMLGISVLAADNAGGHQQTLQYQSDLYLLRSGPEQHQSQIKKVWCGI